MLTEGQKFPDFALKNQDGKDISLKEFAGKWLVVYFYPKDDTPGCTIQGKSFTATKEEFDKANITVLGVSQDDVASHKDFCNKFAFKIDLLADTEKQLLKDTGIGQSEYKGNMYWDRTTFVVNPEGNVAKVYQKVTPDGHEQTLLKEITELQKTAQKVH
jgi:peroxiredoxin Q/BCP